MNIPNLLTLTRFLSVIPLILFLENGNFLAASAIFTFSILTDFIDGRLARKYNLVTAWGKLMDPLADKILISTCLIYFSKLNILPAWITATIIAREFSVNGVRQIAIKNGIVLPAHWSGKWKTLFQIILCFWCFAKLGEFFQNSPINLFLNSFLYGILQWLVLLLTIFSGIYYIKKISK